MSPVDDFPHEMSLFFDDGPAPALDEPLRMAGEELTRGPRPEVATAHMAAIAREARLLASAEEARPVGPHTRGKVTGAPWRKALRMARNVGIATATALFVGMMTLAGLAYAGVSLPSAALTAFDRVGITLPNQDEGHAELPDASQHGQDVSEAATAGPGGCEFGQMIAALASSNREDGGHAAEHRQDGAHRPESPCGEEETTTAGAPPENGGQSPGYGKDNHPTGASEEGRSTNPTGNGKDDHPSDGASGQDNTPTGNGKDSHPSDGESGQASNPTGYGKDGHPSGP